MDKDCSDFRAVVLGIAENKDITSAIIRMQDTFSKNNLEYLILVNKRIEELLKKSFPSIEERVIEDAATYISGLHGFHIKAKVAILKKHAPHFAKWFDSTLARNIVLSAMDRDEKANRLCDAIVNNSFDKNGNVTNLENVEVSLTALQRVKEIYSKTPKPLERLVDKHYNIEEIDNVEDIFNKFKSRSSA